MLKKLLLSVTLLCGKNSIAEEAISMFDQLMSNESWARSITEKGSDAQQQLKDLLTCLEANFHNHELEDRAILEKYDQGTEVLKEVMGADGFNFAYKVIPYNSSALVSCDNTDEGHVE